MTNAAIYCAAVGGIGTLALARHGQPAAKVWELVAVLMASFLLAASAALFFSTFLHPLMAAAAAGFTLATLGAVGRVLGAPWSQVLPAYTLTHAMVSFGLQGWRAPWMAAACAILHAFVFWILATLVFARRDIAVAVE
jgi:hypothetical protein